MLKTLSQKLLTILSLLIFIILSESTYGQQKSELPSLKETITYIENIINNKVISIGVGNHNGRLVNGYLTYPTKYEGEISLEWSDCQLTIKCTDNRVYNHSKTETFIINLSQLNTFSAAKSYSDYLIINSNSYGIEYDRSKGGIKYPKEIQLNFYMGMDGTIKRLSNALTHASELCGVEYKTDPFDY